MKRWMTLGVGVVATIVSSLTLAQFSGTVTLTSDYDYRGISQTAGDPAVQGSVDYGHDSGFYASAWGSTLDWGDDSDADIEIDYIVGFSRDFVGSGLAWDVGILTYTYPGLSAANFVEFYAGLNFKSFDMKISYSDDFAGVGEGGWYLNGGYSHEWENGFNVLVYGGYSFGNAFDQDHGQPTGFPHYWNYGVGVGYTIKHFYFELKGVGTDFDTPYKVSNGVFENDFRAVLSVTFSIP